MASVQFFQLFEQLLRHDSSIKRITLERTLTMEKTANSVVLNPEMAELICAQGLAYAEFWHASRDFSALMTGKAEGRYVAEPLLELTQERFLQAKDRCIAIETKLSAAAVNREYNHDRGSGTKSN